MTDSYDNAGRLIEVSQSLAADFSTRTVRGLLVPWGETSRPSGSGMDPVLFERGGIPIPEDITVLSVNRNHDRYDPIARFESVEDTEAGLVAEFRVATGKDGDALLEAISAGRLNKLSAEVRNIVVTAGKAVATLTGAAFVAAGAFVSAGLFSLAPDDETSERVPTAEELESLLRLAADRIAEYALTQTPEAEASDTDTPDIPEAEATSAEENPEEEIVSDFATLPEGVGSAPAASTADTSASALVSAFTRLNTSGASVSADFALADIVPANTPGTTVPQYVGELWQARQYTQKVLPLFGHADLRSMTVTGFRWTTTPTVGLYSGNKTEIPSAAVATESYSQTAQRIAGGHDIDRVYRDFSNEAFWDGYFRHMTDSYAKVADDYVFSLIEDAADANIVSVDDEGITDPFVWLVDAALQVEANGFTPTFALVAPAVYKTILTKGKDNTLEYFNSAFGLTEGNFGGFRLIPHAGVAAAGHKAIVGSRDAATVYELAGSPIRVEGIDVAKAGIDPALYGYIAVTINKATGLVVIDGDA